MGDRLTLETADEERVWVAVIAETCSTREADAAVRAYRERLPERRQGEDTATWMRARAELGRALGLEQNTPWALCIHEAEGLRGPTEGASDTGDDTPRYSEALRMVAGASVWNEDRWHTPGGFTKPAAIPGMLRDFFEDLDARGRPPTGEASPTSDEDQHVRDLAQDMRLYHASARAEPDGRISVTYDDALSLATLLATSATVTSSPTTPAPQVPDSPGWWWLGESDKRRVVEVFVPRGGHPSVMLVNDTRGGLRSCPTYHISEPWGGRCTRDAPDASEEPT